ncbi:hypothetical protein H0X06_00670 [Candidatus Dependentiae bacterium]|nr:hypothetical protein [Candidatus Dependentiae bacterium]
MKTMYYFSLMLLTAMQLLVAQNESSRTGAEPVSLKKTDISLKEKKHQKGSSYLSETRIIRQKDIGSTGFIIKKSGNYSLAEDISFIPGCDSGNAITIRASNVTIDLNGKKLFQGNDKRNTLGILICPRQHTITIKNGFIENFGAIGVWVSKGASYIDFSNLAIKDCGNRGTGPKKCHVCVKGDSLAPFAGSVAFGGCEGNRIIGVTIKNCHFAAAFNFSDDNSVASERGNIIAGGVAGAFVDGFRMEESSLDVFDLSSTFRTPVHSFFMNNALNPELLRCSLVVQARGVANINGLILANVVNALVTDTDVSFFEDRDGVDLVLNDLPVRQEGDGKEQSIGVDYGRSVGIAIVDGDNYTIRDANVSRYRRVAESAVAPIRYRSVSIQSLVARA